MNGTELVQPLLAELGKIDLTVGKVLEQLDNQTQDQIAALNSKLVSNVRKAQSAIVVPAPCPRTRGSLCPPNSRRLSPRLRPNHRARRRSAFRRRTPPSRSSASTSMWRAFSGCCRRAPRSRRRSETCARTRCRRCATGFEGSLRLSGRRRVAFGHPAHFTSLCSNPGVQAVFHHPGQRREPPERGARRGAA